MPDTDERPIDESEEVTEDQQSDEASTSFAVPVHSSSDDTDEFSAMHEMVEFVARALASNPDAVSVTEEEDGGRTVFRLSVDEKDKGKIIGRDGRVAQAIRSLLRVAATKAGSRVTLEID